MPKGYHIRSSFYLPEASEMAELWQERPEKEHLSGNSTLEQITK